MPAWEQFGMQAAGQTAGAAMGLILQGLADRRQLRQQQKLQDMQIAGNKQLTEYNMQKQLEMWRNTSYPAQMAMMKAAGLNPALMYQSGGEGGSTNITEGNISGANAPTGGGEIQHMAGMGIMSALQAAQIENIKAQTKQIQVETAKTAGVDTALGEQTIEKLKQDIKSQQTQNALTEVQTAIASIQEHVAGETQNMEISKIAAATKMITNDAAISDATKETIITKIKRETLQVYLQNQLIKSQTKLTDQQKLVAEQQISKMIADIEQNRYHLNTERLQVELKHWAEVQNMPIEGEQMKDIIRNIGVLLPIPGGKQHTPVSGFHKR